MKKNLLFALPAAAIAVGACSGEKKPTKPNVILIVADDLGLGDISLYGSKTINTPNIDKLGNEGIRFDNAYATSATSTPSRYAMFTGLYPWRNEDAKILPGDAPLLIPTDIPTMPKMFQAEGYNTAAIGKWHLGMGDGNVDWNKPISPSGNTVGFDFTCLVAATNDRVPTVYVQNGLVEGLEADDPIEVSYEKNFEGEPTALTNPEMLKMQWSDGHNCSIVNGIPRIGYMKGGEKAKWVDEDMADYFVNKVKRFLDEQSSDKPFFMYYGLHQPHVPRAPHSRFVGSTTLGPRGDAVVEADWCVGELYKYLEEKGMLENTLIIFTSDNGPVLDDGYVDFCVERLGNHDPRNGTRGGKYSLFDGGTHIPLAIYWKGHLEPMVSKAMVSQLDFFASMSELLGTKSPEGIDSQNHLNAFMGKDSKGRENLISEAQGRVAYRYGSWMLLPPYTGRVRNNTQNELGNLGEWGLFNLEEDPGQMNNIIDAHPDLANKMKEEFKAIVGDKLPETWVAPETVE